MKKRGKGIAATFYGTGYGNGFPDISICEAEVDEQGRILIYTGATEVGQGAKTSNCSGGDGSRLGKHSSHLRRYLLYPGCRNSSGKPANL